jgi:hypothetical protein
MPAFSIASVVPFAAADHDGTGDSKLQQQCGGVATGVLHQDESDQSIVVDRAAIDLTDLISR